MAQNRGKWCGEIAGTSIYIALSQLKSPLSGEKQLLASPHALEKANGSLYPAKVYWGLWKWQGLSFTLGIGDKVFIIFLEIAP